MKKSILLLCFIWLTTCVKSQDWRNEMLKPNRNFYDVQRKANQFFNLDSKAGQKNMQQLFQTNKPDEHEGEAGYKIYKRWEEFWKTRVYSDGSFPRPDVVY
ncbi:MAG TPA: hypothetical protein PLO59_03135, partial [Bacteroidia bacterium]|nr:hypothetical protein [Bacteroidia bacterium]